MHGSVSEDNSASVTVPLTQNYMENISFMEFHTFSLKWRGNTIPNTKNSNLKSSNPHKGFSWLPWHSWKNVSVRDSVYTVGLQNIFCRISSKKPGPPATGFLLVSNTIVTSTPGHSLTRSQFFESSENPPDISALYNLGTIENITDLNPSDSIDRSIGTLFILIGKLFVQQLGHIQT